MPTPNVSYVTESSQVHFKPYTPPPTVVVTYNATPDNLYTLHSTTGVEQLFVDDVEVTNFGSTYSFSTEGEHTVRVVFNEDGVIPQSMFSGTTVTSVDINDEITNINYNAFRDCSGLTGITIPNSVTTIGQCAFSGCTGLTGITIPNSVTKIGISAFRDCSGLTGTLVIPNSVTSIGSVAFHNCSGLTGITIPNSVSSIKNDTFAGCKGLTSITIPNSVSNIETAAFSNCSRLTRITIPDSVTNIEQSVFRNCSGLTEVTIGSGVTSIGNYTFSGCTGLTQITCYAKTAPTIQSQTFHSVKSNGVLYYPVGSDYSTWLQTTSYYLGYYNWTGQEIAS